MVGIEVWNALNQGSHLGVILELVDDNVMEPKVVIGFPAQPPVLHGATVHMRRQRVPRRTRQKPTGEDATVDFVVEGKKTMGHLLWKPIPQRLAAQCRTVGPNPAMTVEQAYA